MDIPDPEYQDTYRRLPELAPLPTRFRLAFALCCCERLYPSYRALAAFLQTPDVLRPILDRLWRHVLGRAMTEVELDATLAACESIELGEDDCCEHFWDGVNAADAVSVALNACREYELDNVVRVAEHSRERIGQPLWDEMTDPMDGPIGPEEVQRIDDAILSHPMMVAEVRRESEQLRFLYECEELTEDRVTQLLSL